MGREAAFEVFKQFLELGLPVVVPVNTWSLLHWEGFVTNHAIVVVGIDVDNETVYVHDPFFGEAPLAVSLDEFDPAWTEKDRRYAVVGLNTFSQ